VFAAVSPGSGHTPVSQAAGSQSASSASAKPSAPAKAVAPLQVMSVTPASGAKDANGAAPVKVTFNEALSTTTPLPALSPKIDGTWTVSGDTARFQPTLGYTAGTHVSLTIPGGLTGIRAAGLATSGTTTTAATDAGLLPTTTTLSFTTGTYSTLRLQELLTQLGYLPLTFTPAVPTAPVVPSADPNAQLSAAYNPPAGSFTFEPGYPSELTSQWATGQANMLDNGAIRAFENDNGLTMDGVAGPAVWTRLLAAVAAAKTNQNGYTYSLVSQKSPETLWVYHDGSLIEKTPVNTGVPGAGTSDGTYPVYARFQVTQMKGTNPDGSKYDDTVYWVSYFNGGDALHYFPRPGYGYYQSNGCVEMQLDPAKYIWNYTTYGSLVTVTGPVA
jgi:lipoprotein-anchoring transpeptidase ErfK/SrfK